MNSHQVVIAAVVCVVAVAGLILVSNATPTGNAMCGVNEDMKVLAVDNGVTIWGCTPKTTRTMTAGDLPKEGLVSGPFGVTQDPYIARPNQKDYAIGPDWSWDLSK